MVRILMLLVGLGYGLSNVVLAAPEQHVVLISLDGFRHDYIEKHDANALGRIAKNGVRADRMTPVFPANTFPNHLSLVTGLVPAKHGIVNNAFLDKQRVTDKGYARYHMGKGYKDSSWLSGIPLWTLVELNGRKAASYFWPESDARFFGMTPTYHYHYSKHASYQQRIDQIIDWLKLPGPARPQFVAGYFSLVDTTSHDFGPDSPQTHQAVQTMDALMGQLYDRLQQLPIAVNLVVVSDHGMLNVSNSNNILVPELKINSEDFELVNEGAQLHIYARPHTSKKAITTLHQRLTEQNKTGVIVLDSKLRNRYSMSNKTRGGDILLQAKAGHRFVDNADKKVSPGGHGYLPEHKDMGALFVASGPAFKTNYQLKTIQNIDVYPALAHILGLNILQPVDGNVDALNESLTIPLKTRQ